MIQVINGGIDGLAHVVGGNVGGHTYGDALRAVDQQVRQLAGQDHRLLFLLIVIRHKVDGVFLQVRKQHVLGIIRHAALNITGRGGLIALDGAEVAVAVHHGRHLFPILSHHHDGLPDGTVSVGMIFTHGIAHDTGHLTEGAGGADAQLRHIVENAALNRLQAVPHVRQGPGRDDAHGIVNIAFSHDVGVFDVNDLFL